MDNGSAHLHLLSITTSAGFSFLLEEQISDAAVFYSSTSLYDVRQLIDSKQYNDAAIQLLDAMAFACTNTNVITFHQLLIRYDAFCRAFLWHAVE